MTWNAITATGNIRLEMENLTERSLICNSDWMIIAAGWRYVCGTTDTQFIQKNRKNEWNELKSRILFSRSNLGFNKLYFRYFLHWFCISWRERNFLKKEAPEGTMFNKLKKAAIAMIYGHHDVHFFPAFLRASDGSQSVSPATMHDPGLLNLTLRFFNCPIFILSVQYAI